MAQVEIINTPPGQAPDWVRDAWIGLILPVDMDAVGVLQMGIFGGEGQNDGGYNIPTEKALEFLEKKDQRAARWWYDNLPFMPPWLVFHRDVCKLVEE